MRTALARSVFVFVPACFFVGSCASTTETSQSLRQVDDLLSHIERMQVETLVAKEKSHAALDALKTLTAPTFAGDPGAAYTQFVKAIEQSESQARTISVNIYPMKEAAEAMFQQWTVDLESFGNSRLRSRSAMRMEETRTRYQNVLSTATAVRVAYDAYNSDLRDHALFLGHDFNSAAVQTIAGDVAAMSDQVAELDQRFQACVEASKGYIEAGALHGQLETETPETTTSASTTTTTTTTTTKPAQPRKRRMTTLPPAQEGTPASTPTPTSGTTTPEGTPTGTTPTGTTGTTPTGTTGTTGTTPTGTTGTTGTTPTTTPGSGTGTSHG
ncbi:MAG: DUF2959 family protein [Planctomycetes bacterium]|nr:DUF2959 family protein [Planctomycetota bacterium]